MAGNRVGSAELDRFYGQVAKAGPGPLGIRKSHAILSAASNQAAKWGWVDVTSFFVLQRTPLDRLDAASDHKAGGSNLSERAHWPGVFGRSVSRPRGSSA
jgi:hypothetical protein